MKRFRKLLCVVDPENMSETAFVQSLRIADEHQADITFMSVLKTARSWRAAFRTSEEYNNDLDEFEKNIRNEVERKLLSISPSMKSSIVVASGIPFIEVIKRALDDDSDLVVKCAEDVDWLDRMIGSEDMHLLRKCPCPVLILKPGQTDSFRKVLATVDVNDDFGELDDVRAQEQLNQQVLEYSAALSMPELSELHIGSVWEAYAENFYRYGTFSSLPEDQVDSYVEKVRRDRSDKLEILVGKLDKALGKDAVQYLSPRTHLVKGNPSKEIPLMVEKYDIDLIVMGTVGRVGIPGLIIGNTAESILEQTRCSVLAIKPEGFKSPVE